MDESDVTVFLSLMNSISAHEAQESILIDTLKG